MTISYMKNNSIIFKFTKLLALSLAVYCCSVQAQENCDPCPEQPNVGESGITGSQANVIVIDSYNAFVMMPLLDELESPKKTSFSAFHRIVTQDTPRARDLYGKLTLSYQSGDTSIVDFEVDAGEGLASYSLGGDLDVTETGHSGCGLHDWHQGNFTVQLTASSIGKLKIKGNVDPDADDGGDGEPSSEKQIEIEVFVVKVTDQEETKKWYYFDNPALASPVDVEMHNFYIDGEYPPSGYRYDWSADAAVADFQDFYPGNVGQLVKAKSNASGGMNDVSIKAECEGVDLGEVKIKVRNSVHTGTVLYPPPITISYCVLDGNRTPTLMWTTSLL